VIPTKKRMRPLLGTYVEIGVPECEVADNAITSAFQKIEHIQALLSYHDPASELSRLNASGGDWVSLSTLTIAILKLASDITEKTDGLFNPYVGGALERRGLIPRHGTSGCADRGASQDIEVEEDRARLRSPMRVVLDGIAKGWAVDLAAEQLRATGIDKGFINAGGDIRVFGELNIPIQIRSLSGHLSEPINLCNLALATSSYGHSIYHAAPSALIASGQETAPIGTWTVTANEAYLADALTKVAALSDGERRMDLLASFGAVCVFEERIGF
jgi:FAD:protein FMN transferase